MHRFECLKSRHELSTFDMKLRKFPSSGIDACPAVISNERLKADVTVTSRQLALMCRRFRVLRGWTLTESYLLRLPSPETECLGVRASSIQVMICYVC